MKVQARTNGNIVDLPDGTAEKLVAAGIYDVVEDTPKDEPTPVAPRKKAPK